MSSILKKIGKVALTIAPYVAAPFTGGASLALAPMANKAVAKWNEHDAKKEYEKTGIMPSPNKLNTIMGMVGDVASGYSGAGGFGGVGGTLGGKTGTILRDIGSQTGGGRYQFGGGADGGIMRDYGGGTSGGGYSAPGFAGGNFDFGGGGGGGRNSIMQSGGGNKMSLGKGIGTAIEAIMNRQGVGGQDVGMSTGRTNPTTGPQRRTTGGSAYGPNFGPNQPMYNGRMGRSLGPALNDMDQSNPNLALSIGQGRAEAIRNRRRNPLLLPPMDES